MIEIVIISGTGIVIIIALALYYYRKSNNLREELKKIQSELRSAYIKFGQKIEHLAPFVRGFPDDAGKAIFIGEPLDFVIFGDDYVTFIEIKSGQAQLSPKQKKIRRQIEDGKVEFKEVRY